MKGQADIGGSESAFVNELCGEAFNCLASEVNAQNSDWSIATSPNEEKWLVNTNLPSDANMTSIIDNVTGTIQGYVGPRPNDR